MKKLSIVIMILAAMVAGPVSIAAANDGSSDNCPAIGSGAEFGQHVSMHARTMGGFNGTMNPGMHQGYSTLR